ncbi:MAG: DUF2157 domain-containing protein [Candidatus Paceibacterota bacterium]
MDKNSLLQELRNALAHGVVTAKEVRSVASSYEKTADDRNTALIRTLSFIGGAIILIGVIIFVGMNWRELGSAGRIATTLGSSVVAYALGVILLMTRRERAGYLPQALSLIGIILFPIGLAVLLYEMDARIYTAGMQALIAFLTTVLAVASYVLVEKQRLYAVMAIAAGTWLVVSLVNFITNYGSALPFDSFYMYQWLAIVIGATYVVGGYWLVTEHDGTLSEALYAFGSAGVLVAALSGGDIWNYVYSLVLAGGFVASVYLKSRSIIVTSSIALIAYVIKVTVVYFPEAVAAWPIALIALGGVIMAVSYGAFRLNQRLTAPSNEFGGNDQSL